MQQTCQDATMVFKCIFFKYKPTCTLHSVSSTLATFSWQYVRQKAVLEQFRVLWASTSNAQLFLSVDTPWAIMLQYVDDSKNSELVVKRANGTRWCARADATMALSKGDSSFQKALHVLAEEMTQNYCWR
ncbi:hypothetical protein TNCT_97171 [Trichonephila clavata]|uniref:Uncharacterized protein n=1 Tax=Trichonephila clavata TaxID=2740835 RepID=A0A8X6H7I5_TRICU|nr:hypothetical protein TNCT_97171 [Trichonephila clavata]